MMMFAAPELAFTSTIGPWLFGIGAVGVVVLAIWIHRSLGALLGLRARWAIALLKGCALVALLAWVSGLRVDYQQRETTRNAIAVALDASQSMAISDAPGGATRYDAASNLLWGYPIALSRKIEEHGRALTWTFGERAQRCDTIKGRANVPPHASESETNFRNLFATLKNEKDAEGLRAVVLVSDGNPTDGGNAREAARALQLPVYVVGVGRREEGDTYRDAGVVRVDVPTRVETGVAFPVRVTVANRGMAGRTIGVSVRENDQEIVHSHLSLLADATSEARLTVTPKERGVHEYRVVLEPGPDDAVKENNEAGFTTVATEAHLSTLYVEGTLRWQYKFLKRSLENDPAIHPAFLIATGPGRFTRQGKSDIEFGDSFPSTTEELAQFDVLILGDLGRDILTDARLSMIDDFVAQQGKGLLILGGPSLFNSGVFDGTPLAALSPVGFVHGPAHNFSPFVAVERPPEAAIHPLYQAFGRAIRSLRIGRLYPLGPSKPAATILLIAGPESGNRMGSPNSRSPGSGVLVAVQPYGKGRVMLVASDDLWRSTLAASEGDKAASSASVLWSDALRWLSGRDPGGDAKDPPIIAYADSSYYNSGMPVDVKASLNTTLLNPETTQLEMTIRRGYTEIARTQMQRSDEAGRYRATWKPTAHGVYRGTVAVAGQPRKGGKPSPPGASFLFTVGQPYREMEQAGLNEFLLRDLASETGGRYYTLATASQLPGDIDAALTTRTRRVEKPLSQIVWLYAAFVALLGAEWFLRRRWNLV